MAKMRKTFVLTVAAFTVVAALSLLIGCNYKPSAKREYRREDLSDYTSEELEAVADYHAFYRPQSGKISDIAPYYGNGVYSIFYAKTGEDYPSRPLHLVETSDFINYTERGEVLSASGLSGESATGVCSVIDVAGTYYMFYTAQSESGRTTLRAASSDTDFYGFTREQNFIFHPDDGAYGFDRGSIDAAVCYDEDISRFVCVVSAKKDGRAVLALYYFDDMLSKDYIEFGGILYEDRYGFDALSSLSLFRLGGEYYITFYAEDGRLEKSTESAETDPPALCGASGKMYCLRSSALTGPYRDCGAALDSAVFCGAKTVMGSEPVMIGRLLERDGNDGFKYGASGNFAAHSLLRNPDGTLSLTYPHAVTEYFSMNVPAVGHADVTDGTAVIADEVPSYRLSAKFGFGAETAKFGLIFGDGGDGDGVRLTFDPVFGKIKASYGGNDVAVGYISLAPDTEYSLDVFCEGSAFAAYIDGAAFSFRARDCGNKKISAFADGGRFELDEIRMLASGTSAVESGYYALDPGESKELSVTAKSDCYYLGEANIYCEEEVAISLVCGEREITARGKGLVVFSECLPADKGESAVLRIAAGDQTVVYGTVKLRERYDGASYKPLAYRETAGRGSALTVDGEGYYRFDAMVIQENETAGTLVVECDGETVSSVGVANGFARACGYLHAKADSVVTASVDYGGEVSSYTVRLDLFAADRADSRPTGGAVARGMKEWDIEYGGDRDGETDAKTSFGAQGNNGFVFTYGRAADEILPMDGFDGALYTVTDAAADKVSVAADRITAGGGFGSGVTYVASKSGKKNIEASVDPDGEGMTFIGLYHNRIALDERIVSGDGAYTVSVTASLDADDRITLFVIPVGGNAECAADYGFAVKKYEEQEKPQPGDGAYADFGRDFYTDEASANGWLYGYSSNYDFGLNTFEFTRFDRFAEGAWKDSEIGGIEIKHEVRDDGNGHVKKLGWLLTENNTCDAAVAYRFDRAGTFDVNILFDGTNGETRLAARVVTTDASGNTLSADFIADGQQNSDWTAARTVTVGVDYTVYVIFFREGTAWTQGAFNITVTEA